MRVLLLVAIVAAVSAQATTPPAATTAPVTQAPVATAAPVVQHPHNRGQGLNRGYNGYNQWNRWGNQYDNYPQQPSTYSCVCEFECAFGKSCCCTQFGPRCLYSGDSRCLGVGIQSIPAAVHHHHHRVGVPSEHTVHVTPLHVHDHKTGHKKADNAYKYEVNYTSGHLHHDSHLAYTTAVLFATSRHGLKVEPYLALGEHETVKSHQGRHVSSHAVRLHLSKDQAKSDRVYYMAGVRLYPKSHDKHHAKHHEHHGKHLEHEHHGKHHGHHAAHHKSHHGSHHKGHHGSHHGSHHKSHHGSHHGSHHASHHGSSHHGSHASHHGSHHGSHHKEHHGHHKAHHGHHGKHHHHAVSASVHHSRHHKYYDKKAWMAKVHQRHHSHLPHDDDSAFDQPRKVDIRGLMRDEDGWTWSHVHSFVPRRPHH